MSEAKRTPGPWEMVADAADGKHAIYAESNGYRVATVHNFNGSSENRANARLIAAAPDLLEALIALRESALDTLAAATGWEASLDSCVDAASAAIAKALGSAA